MSADPAPHLTLVNTETGEQIDYDGENGDIFALRERVRELELGLELANKDLDVKRRKISELLNIKEAKRQRAEARPLVEWTFAYWQRACEHRLCKLTPDRYDAIWAAIEREAVDMQDPDSVAAFKRRAGLAIDGAAHDPFTRPRKNGTVKKFDDLSLIFRTADHTDEFIRRSPHAASALRRAQARQRAMARHSRSRAPDPRSLGGSWALEARMLTVFNGNGPHLQAR